MRTGTTARMVKAPRKAGSNQHLPTILGDSSRVGGLVHPSYVCGRLAPTKIPLKSPGLVHPPERSVGSSPPSTEIRKTGEKLGAAKLNRSPQIGLEPRAGTWCYLVVHPTY